MAEPFRGEIRFFSFAFAPKGWATCDGQLMPINQNQALFALLGTTFGGNGQTTFALPDYRGCVPIHVGNGHTLGEKGGEQSHTITINELPTHRHGVDGTADDAAVTDPSNALLANVKPSELFGTAPPLVAMAPATVTSVGGSQAHMNMQPYLTISFCIALEGIFPSKN